MPRTRQILSEVANNQFRWANKLDGAQSRHYQFDLKRPVTAYYRGGLGRRPVGKLVTLPPGRYCKGSAYVSPGVKKPGASEYSTSVFDPKELHREKPTPEAMAWLKAQNELFPCHPIGDDISTINLYWVPVADLQANAVELTPEKKFRNAAKSILPELKAKTSHLRLMLMNRILDINIKNPEEISQAYEDWTEDWLPQDMGDENFDEKLMQLGDQHDKVFQWLEQNIFNWVMKELGATDQDLEV